MIPESTRPQLPERLARLQDLAGDLWWSWHGEAREVFRRIDYGLWRVTAHNPERMIRLLTRDKLETAAADVAFLAIYDGAVAALDAARAAHNTWWTNTMTHLSGQTNAEFSAGFS